MELVALLGQTELMTMLGLLELAELLQLSGLLELLGLVGLLGLLGQLWLWVVVVVALGSSCGSSRCGVALWCTVVAGGWGGFIHGATTMTSDFSSLTH